MVSVIIEGVNSWFNLRIIFTIIFLLEFMMILVHLFQRLNYSLFIFNSKLYSNSFRTQQCYGIDGNTFSKFKNKLITPMT